MASCPPRPRRRSRRWESRTWNWAWTPPRRATRPTDIRALMRRYEETGIDAASLGAVGYRGRSRRRAVPRARAGDAESESRKWTRCGAWAPLHNGIAVATMKAGLAAIPQLPHVAVFDTAFHAPLPEGRVPVRRPRALVSRLGRSTLRASTACRSPGRRSAPATLLARPAGELRLVWLTWGAAASVTARRSMGGAPSLPRWASTPLEGLMMGTRSGSLDPGILFYLLHNGWARSRRIGRSAGPRLRTARGLRSNVDVRELSSSRRLGMGRPCWPSGSSCAVRPKCIAAAATVATPAGCDRLHGRDRRERRPACGPGSSRGWRRSG